MGRKTWLLPGFGRYSTPPEHKPLQGSLQILWENMKIYSVVSVRACLCLSPPFSAWSHQIHGFRIKTTRIASISLQLFAGVWLSAAPKQRVLSSRIQYIHFAGTGVRYIGWICDDLWVVHLVMLTSDPGNRRLPSASDHAARGYVQRDEPSPGEAKRGP